MPKYYYDDALIAAYMAKYQRMDFGAEIHSVFNNLCTTDPQVAASPVRFYLDEKNLKELEPQDGDLVKHTYPVAFWGSDGESIGHTTKTTIGEYRVGWKGNDNYKILEMIQRNDMPFFVPKAEE